MGLHWLLISLQLLCVSSLLCPFDRVETVNPAELFCCSEIGNLRLGMFLLGNMALLGTDVAFFDD
jgi:hypothetical protein